jgi:hypothetical protein
MFKKPNPNADALDKAIERAFFCMEGISPSSDEYAKMVKQLKELHGMKVSETSRRISPDTWLTVAANLGGILMILTYEHANPLASKAVSFVAKLR